MSRNGNTTPVELGPITARLLVRVANSWGVSEEEAIRRALEQADAATETPNIKARIQAFKDLQQRLNLTPVKAAEWEATVRKARR